MATLKDFKLHSEDETHYHLDTPSGKRLAVEKKSLSQKGHDAIKKFCSGGMAEGGDVPTSHYPLWKDEKGNISEGPEKEPMSEDEKDEEELNFQNEKAYEAEPGYAKGGQVSAKDMANDIQELARVHKSGTPKERVETISRIKNKYPHLTKNIQHFDDGGTAMPSDASTPASAPPEDPTAGINPDVMSNPPPVDTQTAPQAPPQAAAPDQSELAQKSGAIQQALEKEQAANTLGAQAVQGQGEMEAGAAGDIGAKIASLPTQQQIIANYAAKDAQLADAYQKQTIDPNRLFHQMGTGGKILALVGTFLGGLGGGISKTGGNQGLQVIQNAVDRDIDAQKADQSRNMNLWKMNREAMGNDLQADLATKNQMYQAVKYKFMQAQSKFMGPIAQAKALQANALIDKEIAMNNFQLSLMQPSSDNPDPSTRVPYLIKDSNLQKQSFEEIKNATNVSNNGPKMLEAFDKAANTVNAVDFIPGMENRYQKDLHQLLLPNFKSIDGTVRQAAMDETFKNVTPQFMDNAATKATKRQALQDWMTSESAAPVSKGHGIDLSKFPSTSENALRSAPKLEIRKDANGNLWKMGPNGKPIRVK